MVVRIEARGLGFTYGGGEGAGADDSVRALDGLDLDVHEGEVLAVLGPNGAGKSTLLKLLAGLLTPTDGGLLLEGRPLDAFTPRERARSLAVVPQSLTALPEVTVEAFVGYGRYAHERLFGGPRVEDREAVARALEAADCAALAKRPLAELSGGQRQRALIARALAQEARTLLIDEPTNALDPEHQLRVFDLLADLADEGHAIVVVTHDLNLASQFSDRALLLDGGAQAALGAIEAVLRPEVLEPVYGPDLCFGSLPSARAGVERPFVLPWRR